MRSGHAAVVVICSLRLGARWKAHASNRPYTPTHARDAQAERTSSGGRMHAFRSSAHTHGRTAHEACQMIWHRIDKAAARSKGPHCVAYIASHTMPTMALATRTRPSASDNACATAHNLPSMRHGPRRCACITLLLRAPSRACGAAHAACDACHLTARPAAACRRQREALTHRSSEGCVQRSCFRSLSLSLCMLGVRGSLNNGL